MAEGGEALPSVGEELPSACNYLKEPLAIEDLVKGDGAKFEIVANFGESYNNEIYDELNLDDDGDSDTETVIEQVKIVSPWTKPFKQLKEQMQNLNDYMWKRIVKHGDEDSPKVAKNSRVCIRYNAYWEGEGAPFDSSFLRGSSYTFYTGRNEVLEGLEAAVKTMRKGEDAEFVISYHLLFREMGCPPRVKPKADALFIIELVSFNEVGNINADEELPVEDRDKFALVVGKVKEIHLKGLDFFGQKMYRNACLAFEKAVNILKFCNLSSDEEEKEQRQFLIKLYTNLAVCYIKLNSPTKTCIMGKEIRQLTSNNPSCKAIFQEGRALIMLGDYVKARRLLIKAQSMEPSNDCINSELKILEERYRKHKEGENKMWTKAMGIIKESDVKKCTKKPNDGLKSTEKQIYKLLCNFKENEKQSNIKLPTGLTGKEIGIVEALAKSLNLKLTINPLNADKYTITKE